MDCSHLQEEYALLCLAKERATREVNEYRIASEVEQQRLYRISFEASERVERLKDKILHLALTSHAS